MVLRGWRQVRKLHQAWERSGPRSEPQSATAINMLPGVQAMPDRTLQAAPEEGFGKLSGEERILRPALPVAISVADLRRLSLSWPQPLPLATQPSLLPGVP